MKKNRLLLLLVFFILSFILVSYASSSNTTNANTDTSNEDPNATSDGGIVRGESFLVQADPDNGFYWPYYAYVPQELSSDYVWVCPNNTGFRDDDLEVHKSWAKWLMDGWSNKADEMGTAMLIPVFPRPVNEVQDSKGTNQYLGFGAFEEEAIEYARQDLQLIQMINDFVQTLQKVNPSQSNKILMYGASASGGFVSRFAILHPELVQAAAFGAYGWATSPIENHEGNSLPFPYGI